MPSNAAPRSEARPREAASGGWGDGRGIGVAVTGRRVSEGTVMLVRCPLGSGVSVGVGEER